MEIPVNFGNVRFIFTCFNVADPMSMSLGFQGDIAWDPADAADKWYTAWTDQFVPDPESFYAGWTFVGTSVTKNVAGDPVVAEHIEPLSGSVALQSLTVNTCVLVKKNTAAGGRKNRGRMFVPPFNLAESDVDAAGNISSVFVGIQQGMWVDTLSAMAVDNYFPWLLHTDPADSPTAITSLTVQGLAATQRRRMR